MQIAVRKYKTYIKIANIKITPIIIKVVAILFDSSIESLLSSLVELRLLYALELELGGTGSDELEEEPPPVELNALML